MQDLIDVELCETPVTLSDYKSYDLKQLPKAILGFQIKNQFDEKRLQFKTKYNAKKILHYSQSFNKKDQSLEPIFFYGVELNLKEKYKEILIDLNNNIILANIILKAKKVDVVEEYKNYLNKINLACNDTFLHTRDGVYPIDLKYLQELIDTPTDIPIYDLPSMLEITKEQWYLNIGSFGIYILSKSGFYNL